MADERKNGPKPEDPKGKGKRPGEPFMNFELPEDSKTDMEPVDEPIEVAEVVEEDIPVVEEAVPIVDELDDDAVEVIEDEPEVVISDEEIEALEAMPASSKVMEAPLVAEEIESGVDLSGAKSESKPSEKDNLGESDIDLNAILDEVKESSAVDLGAVGHPTSIPVSPVPEPVHAEAVEHEPDFTEIADTIRDEDPVEVVDEAEARHGLLADDAGIKDDEIFAGEKESPPPPRGKKDRGRELVGAGGGGRKRGGFMPFLFGFVLAALLLGGAGAAAWYFNILADLPKSPSAPGKAFIAAKNTDGDKKLSALKTAVVQPDLDPAGEKNKPAAEKNKDESNKEFEDKLATLKAEAEKEADAHKQVAQQYDALKSALAEANLPQQPDKLKPAVDELVAARKKLEDMKDAPPAKVAAKENEDKKAAELPPVPAVPAELAKDYDVLLKKHEALVKDLDAAVTAREALAKDNDGLVKDKEMLAKEKEALASDKDALAKEREAALKERETLAKDRDAMAKDYATLKTAFDDTLKKVQAGQPLGKQIEFPKSVGEGLKKPESAVAQPEVAPEPNPLMGEKHFGKGLDFFWARRYTEAEMEFVKAVFYSDDDARYRYFLGLSRYVQGTSDKRNLAGADFEKGVQLERQRRPSMREVNASLERVQGDLRRVVNAYRERT
jgi:hypothetical protein